MRRLRLSAALATFLLVTSACGGTDGDPDAAGPVAETTTTVGESTTTQEPAADEPPATEDTSTVDDPPADDGAAATEATTTTTLRTMPLDVVDAFDNAVTIPAVPERVFAGDDTSLANLLELGVRPVGMAVNPNAVPDFLADQLEGIVDVSADTGLRINIEALAALEPDLIIGPGTPLLQLQYELATEIAPTYAYRYGYASSDELRTNLTDVARLFSLEDRAAEIIEELDTRIADLRSRLAASEVAGEPVSVLRVFADGAGLSLRHGTTESVLMAEIGIERPANQQSIEGFATDVSLETLTDVDAYAIYVYVDDPFDTSAYDEMLASPLWQTLDAVQNDRVFLVDGGIWNGISIAAAHLILDDLERTLGF
ncbi:MAG: iron-siderophore ABC transporter substrate-binding protein [Actinomycetota bacterium]